MALGYVVGELGQLLVLREAVIVALFVPLTVAQYTRTPAADRRVERRSGAELLVQYQPALLDVGQAHLGVGQGTGELSEQ